MFFKLVFRLPAYSGAMASVVRRQERDEGGSPRRAGGSDQARYERRSPMANNARSADQAPPATAGVIAGLNAQLGGGWFSHRTVKADPGE